jgi:hypothetical protein
MMIISALIQTYLQWKRYRGTVDHLIAAGAPMPRDPGTE